MAEQRLLIISDDHNYGRTGLALPFAEATVLEAPVAPEDLVIDDHFDGLFVDRRNFDLGWLDAVIGRVLAMMRTNWWMAVAFDPTGALSPRLRPGEQPNLSRLRWYGLTLVNGRTCALLGDGPAREVLSRSGLGVSHDGTGSALGPDVSGDLPTGLAPSLLATVDTALRLEHSAGVGVTGGALANVATRGEAERILREHLEDRRRSEHALIGHLDVLAVELEKAREAARRLRQPSMLARTVLRRSGPGRALLGVLRRGRRMARKLRRAASQ